MAATGSYAAALLADGRFPAGGHAHSFGFEAASSEIGLASADDVEAFVVGRLHTVGRAEAGLVAAAHVAIAAEAFDPDVFDAEVEARIVAPELRSASRQLGRHWLRAGHRTWPERIPEQPWSTQRPHQAPAFALVAQSAGVDVATAVAISIHHLVSGIATAAVRIHGIDPYRVQRIQADRANEIARIVEDVVACAGRPLAEIPAPSNPLADVHARLHAAWDVRLFQS